MLTNILFIILIIIAIVIAVELALAIKVLRDLLAQDKNIVVQSATTSVTSEVSSAKIRESGNLRVQQKTEKKCNGLRICPNCYSAIDMDAKECPACKNTLR